jgi:hypothetical protein
MPANSGAKANGAAHRMGNAHLKERRKSSWARGERTKDARRQAQEEAHKRNLVSISNGDRTPWQATESKD